MQLFNKREYTNEWKCNHQNQTFAFKVACMVLGRIVMYMYMQPMSANRRRLDKQKKTKKKSSNNFFNVFILRFFIFKFFIGCFFVNAVRERSLIPIYENILVTHWILTSQRFFILSFRHLSTMWLKFAGSFWIHSNRILLRWGEVLSCSICLKSCGSPFHNATF